MTGAFLKNKIQSVLDDFENEKWCDLNVAGFNSDNYSIKTQQQKYILKYYAAYFCELYEMYGKFFNDFKGESVNILSIGCGSGVDCEALNRVCIDKNITIRKNYRGVDLVDWYYRPMYEWASFDTMCASKLNSNDVENIDLFVFPKSLTELTMEVCENIANALVDGSKKSVVYFINTYVTNDPSDSRCVDGLSQFGKINSTLTKNKLWKCIGNASEYYYKRNGGWLGYNYSFFELPDDLVLFVSELKDSCNNHNNSPTCKICEINFFPILNSKYLAFNLIKYEKE
ncbi:hypothetical protein AAHD08_000243 [Providencia rettgeri]